MRKIVAVESVSLDGVMQAPGGPDEDTREGFMLGGWAASYHDDVMMQEMSRGFGQDLLFGRRTYEQFYSFWPKQDGNPFTDVLNNATNLLLIHPVLLNSGRRLFADTGSFAELELVNSVTTTTASLLPRIGRARSSTEAPASGVTRMAPQSTRSVSRAGCTCRESSTEVQRKFHTCL